MPRRLWWDDECAVAQQQMREAERAYRKWQDKVILESLTGEATKLEERKRHDTVDRYVFATYIIMCVAEYET